MRNKGFTLIEVILIMVVAAIAIPVMLMALGGQSRLSVRPEIQITQANLGQALLEEIKARGYSSAGAYAGYSDTATLGGQDFQRSAEVCNVPSADPDDTANCFGAETGYRRIKVTVTGGEGSTGLITLVTDGE